MLKPINRKIIAAMFTFLFWQNSYCQKQNDSLYSYLTIAARNNPSVIQRYREYEASLQRVPQAGALPDPTLSAGIFLQPMELMAGYEQADLRLMQMFPWFGVLKNAKDEMSLMAKSKFESFRSAKLQVCFEAEKKWYELIKVKQNLRISQHNKEILQTIEKLAVVRYKSSTTGGKSNRATGKNSSGTASTNSAAQGMQNNMGSSGSAAGNTPQPVNAGMPGNSMDNAGGEMNLGDVYRIQIEIGDIENNIEEQKNKLITLTAEFNALLNRTPEQTLYLPDTIIADSFQTTMHQLDANPMLGMLQYEQQSLSARKKMVTRMGYPMFGIGVNYLLIEKSPMSTSPMNGKDMVMPMFSATLPIYRKKYKGMQNEANMLMDANTQNYRATANALQTEYYQAMQLNKDSKRRYALYSSQFQLATKTLNIMYKSYAASGASLSEILRTQQQNLEYENKLIEALADYNTSIAWLKQLTAAYPEN